MLLSCIKEGVVFCFLMFIWALVLSSPFVTMMFAAEVADIITMHTDSQVGGIVAFLLCAFSYITALLALSEKVDW